jgi:hypothetical protein
MRLTAIDNRMNIIVRRVEGAINRINGAVNNGDLADIAAEAGAKAGLMLQTYNAMLDLVEVVRGVRPTAYIGHADNPTG